MEKRKREALKKVSEVNLKEEVKEVDTGFDAEPLLKFPDFMDY